MARLRVITVLLAIAVLVAVPLAADAQKPPKQPKNTPPPTLSIAAQPALITFGRSSTLSGRLRESGNNPPRTIAIDQNPFPFSGFVPAGTATTDAQGDYRLVVRPGRHTRYRARTTGAYVPSFVSPEVLVRVALRVSFRLSDSTPRRGARVRFFGTVAPKHNGHRVVIQRRRSDGRFVTVARTLTRNTTGNRSSYSRRVRIFRDGVFRIRVRGHSDHASGTSRRRTIRVN